MGRLRRRRFGVTLVEYVDAPDWHVIVTPPYAAACNCHGRPHVHRHPVRGHPDHRPPILVHRDLTLGETIARLRALCLSLDRGPDLEEVVEALA